MHEVFIAFHKCTMKLELYLISDDYLYYWDATRTGNRIISWP